MIAPHELGIWGKLVWKYEETHHAPKPTRSINCSRSQLHASKQNNKWTLIYFLKMGTIVKDFHIMVAWLYVYKIKKKLLQECHKSILNNWEMAETGRRYVFCEWVCVRHPSLREAELLARTLNLYFAHLLFPYM